MNTTGKVLTGFLIGTTVGTLLGVLFAPDKGKILRAQIADKAKATGEAVAKGLGQAKSLAGLAEKDMAKRTAER